MGDLGGLNAGSVRLDLAVGVGVGVGVEVEDGALDSQPLDAAGLLEPASRGFSPGVVVVVVVGGTLPMTAATLVGVAILLIREGEGVDGLRFFGEGFGDLAECFSDDLAGDFGDLDESLGDLARDFGDLCESRGEAGDLVAERLGDTTNFVFSIAVDSTSPGEFDFLRGLPLTMP